MALELKDFGAFLDIEITDETTTDQVKDAFNSKYVTTENHSKALGEVNGILTSAIKKEAKGIDLEFKPEDIKDKTTKELISIFAVNAKAKFTQYETDKGSTNEQLEEKYKGDIDKYKGQLVEKETLLTDLQGVHEAYKTGVVQKERTSKIQGELGKSISTLKFSESVHPLAQEGFKSQLSSKYSFDLNEEGKHVVKDADGKLITSKIKAGEPASYDEVIATAFKDSGLEQVANPKKTSTFVTTPVPVASQNGNYREVAPRDK